MLKVYFWFTSHRGWSNILFLNSIFVLLCISRLISDISIKGEEITPFLWAWICRSTTSRPNGTWWPYRLCATKSTIPAARSLTRTFSSTWSWGENPSFTRSTSSSPAWAFHSSQCSYSTCPQTQERRLANLKLCITTQQKSSHQSLESQKLYFPQRRIVRHNDLSFCLHIVRKPWILSENSIFRKTRTDAAEARPAALNSLRSLLRNLRLLCGQKFLSMKKFSKKNRQIFSFVE